MVVVTEVLSSFPKGSIGLLYDGERLVTVPRHVQEFHIVLVQKAPGHGPFPDPPEQIKPHFAEKDDGNIADMFHLYELPGVEELQQGPYPAGGNDNSI